MWWDDRNCARASTWPGRRRGLRLGAGLVLGAGLPWAFASTRPAPGAPALARPSVGESLLRGCGLPGANVGAYARALDSDTPLVSLNPEKPFQLASTTKLVTAMAALDLLGPHFRWRTMAFTRGTLLRGRLLGDLWIVGGGNAYLRTQDLQVWMAEWRKLGLREIIGDIVLDRFAFQLTEHDHENTPVPAADRPHHMWPDALTLDEGRLKVRLNPSRDGRPEVQLEPPLAGVRIEPSRLGGSGCTAWAQWSDTPRDAEPLIRVQGSLGPRCGSREWVLAPLPHAEFTTRAIAGLWRQSGGQLHGRVIDKSHPDRRSLIPEGADGEPQLPFATHISPPLPQLLREINKTSDNLAARNLMLALSRGFPHRPATLPAAQARMREWLTKQGLGPGDIEIENGSGLSRAEKAKPRAFVDLLAKAWHARQAAALIDSLPVAGVDGTLEHRMTRGAATGQAHLKTGTLLDTRALAGYVKARSGKVYAVTALVNHPEAARATPSLDAFIEWLARAN
ncbi:D-alanyl-D-alanine carboxypeptidase/D-alanyl-D-alanine-endopeptidase [Ideonella sp. DXS29W]|uniref:D-alanyl-D-alanine carboxypeptidase/D-alanyl-D-alanine-endopeptidase n=1 Tax=Ideonella lacteola TaxID=2984193 RepID=A0ABU9BLF7_9BURK